MHEALFYTRQSDHNVMCVLCPWNCHLNPGQTGNCRVRANHNGKLYTLVYNRVAAIAVDPVEKKPFYHFFPGRKILSIGETGCNFHCSFCQNYHISQCSANDFDHFQEITPEQIVKKALTQENNIGIAYTYNEPFTFFEFMADTARLAHDKGLKNAVVSNGYVNPGPLDDALQWTDAFNIDLKSFNHEFYKKYTRGDLLHVKNTLRKIARSKAHLEITTLVIAGLNDNTDEFILMTDWIAGELGKEVPLHLSRYFPHYRMNLPPTPLARLEKLYDLASQKLDYVYLGNVYDPARSSTYCSSCRKELINRDIGTIRVSNLDTSGHCSTCGKKLHLIF